MIKVFLTIPLTLVTLWGVWNYAPLSLLQFNPLSHREEGIVLGSAVQTINLSDSVKDALYTKVNANFAQTANTTTPNVWSSLQTFYGGLSSASSTSGFLRVGYLTATSSDTSTFAGILNNTNTGTSTWTGGISSAGLASSKGITIASGFGALNSLSTATSTLSNGLILTTGCIYLTQKSTCLLPLDLTATNSWTASGTTTFSGGLESSAIAAPYFNATSTTATTTLTALRVSGTATTTNLTISGNCVGCVTFKNGTATRAGNTASGNQTIAHGLGVIPKFVRITAYKTIGTTFFAQSTGSYNGVTSNNVYMQIGSAASPTFTSGVTTDMLAIFDEPQTPKKQIATIAVDATNITLSWTMTSTPSADDINMLWEVEK